MSIKNRIVKNIRLMNREMPWFERLFEQLFTISFQYSNPTIPILTVLLRLNQQNFFNGFSGIAPAV